MEAVIYEDSPLADYLQATGEGDDEWATVAKPVSSPSTESEAFSFAPRGIPTTNGTKRRQRPASQIVFTESLISQIRRRCLEMFAWRIGQSEQIKALEQLRFTIIGSQLLSERSATGGCSRRSVLPGDSLAGEIPVEYTVSGLFYTAGAAFACALSIWWASKTSNVRKKRTRLAIVSTILTAACLAVYGFCLRQYRRYARNYAVRTATAMVGNAQAFDTAAYAASSFIQEVELVARGYKLSTPLPPASRLDDGKSQTRRCRRLRHALRAALDDLIVPHIEAQRSLHSFANAANLERYFDMYEISRSDMDEVAESIDAKQDEDPESLRILKVDLHRLFVSRKLFLCTILALDADRSSSTVDWSMVTEIMEDISNRTAMSATNLDGILGEEQQFQVPTSPRAPLTPNRERVQHHVRRFANLSLGLRGLQAKMHILREESDRSLGSSDEVTQLGTYLLEQYDAIGYDMKSLLSDWEEGRAALTANIGRNERRISSNFTVTPNRVLSRSSSPNNSIGGLTAVGGSPSDALRILNGESAHSSEEEIFEALAAPKLRSKGNGNLTREERIARMREERLRLSAVRETVSTLDASKSMVQELETVIKARPPHRRKVSSPMPPLPVRISAASSASTSASPTMPRSPIMLSPTGSVPRSPTLL